MSTPDFSNLNKFFSAFLAGDSRAGGMVYMLTRSSLVAAIRKRAADLPNDHEDILNECFVLMVEAPRRFNPARASAITFMLAVLVPEAIQRVRAKSARPGTRTRRRKPANQATMKTFPFPDPAPATEDMPVAGYGSPSAIEAACDAHAIFERSTAQLRVVIGGLFEGKTQIEIAKDMQVERTKVVRMVKSLNMVAAAA